MAASPPPAGGGAPGAGDASVQLARHPLVLSAVQMRAADRAAVDELGVPSLLLMENASPDAHRDLLAWLARLAPDGDPSHEHVLEGPDDMPAHLRCVLTRSSETVPVIDGRLALGRWQGIFLLEHRLAGSERQLVVHVSGDATAT